ncbi:MAG TPA: VIT1/CCC1 transporter family protein [Syntrophorhabdales bacterium]|nr:VIT1/CCC1 transporter family protein [Syntrophorhabdales bacterium]
MTNGIHLLRTFWSSEIIAESLYGFLAAGYLDPDRRKLIMQLGGMERGHAHAWNKIATDAHGVAFHVSLLVRSKIVLLKLLSLVLPLPIFIHYMEHREKQAILDYAGLLEAYKDNEKISSIISNIVVQEISHEWHMMEQLADKRLYIAKVKEAIPGMTAGTIETLGLVIGLLAAHARTFMIGLTGVIAMIRGMIAETSVSYISSKEHHDFNEGNNKELDVKKELNPAVLRRELERDLLERGVRSETVQVILGSVGEDAAVLASLVRTIRAGSETLRPGESIKATGVFFVVGALPVLIPFFVGTLFGSSPSIPAVIAFAVAVVSISLAGLFTAVLSGKRISTNILHNLCIILGTAALTYLVGSAARLFLGVTH